MTSRTASMRILAFVLLSLLASAARPSLAQVTQQPFVMGVQPVVGSHSYPPPGYLQSFSALADGEYRNAVQAFRRDLEGSYHFGQSRWIDSICSYAMIGESQYRLGDYRDALDNFENALRLYNQFSNWMLRVQFPAGLGPAPLRARRGEKARAVHTRRAFPIHFRLRWECRTPTFSTRCKLADRWCPPNCCRSTLLKLCAARAWQCSGGG